MRTEADLEAVLAVLADRAEEEIRADDYDAVSARAVATVRPVLPLVVPPGSPVHARRRGRRVWSTIAVAATVAALATGIALTHRPDPSPRAGQQSGSGLSEWPLQVLTFAVSPSARVRIGAVSSHRDLLGKYFTQMTTLSSNAQNYTLTENQKLPAANLHLTLRGSKHVTVRREPAYFGCLYGDVKSTTVAHCGGGQLAWHVRDGGWAVLSTSPSGTSADESALIRVADSLDFTKTTPLRVPFALAQAPDASRLVDLEIDSVEGFSDIAGTSGGGTPRDAYGTVEARYEPDDAGVDNPSPTGQVVSIGFDHQPLPATGYRQGRRIVIDKRPGLFIDQKDLRILFVDTGHGTRLMARVDQPTTLATLTALEQLSRTIRVTQAPSDRQHWFNASNALP